MKLTKKLRIYFFLFSIILLMGNTQLVQAASNSKKIQFTNLKGQSLTLKKGQTKTLQYKITPSLANQKVTFSSSKPQIATINTKGKITAKKVGTTYITIKSKSDSKIAKKLKVQVTNNSYTRNDIKKKVRSIIKSQTNSSMSKVEQIKAIHDYMVLNCEYDKRSNRPASSYNPGDLLFTKTAVCEGYAQTFKLFMDELNVPCEIVTSLPMNHAWNRIKLYGKYYWVDVTWDDPINQPKSFVEHSYFLINDEILLKTHLWDTKVGSAKGGDYLLYGYGGKFAKSVSMIEKSFQNQYKKNPTEISFAFKKSNEKKFVAKLNELAASKGFELSKSYLKCGTKGNYQYVTYSLPDNKDRSFVANKTELEKVFQKQLSSDHYFWVNYFCKKENASTFNSYFEKYALSKGYSAGTPTMKTYGKYKIISYNLSSQYKKALASSPEGLKAKFNELYGQSGVKTMTLLYSADQIANATDILAAAAMQNGRGITRLETDNLGHNYKVTTISLTEQLTKNVYVASEEELRALFYAQSGKSTKITFTCLPANFDAFSSAITDLANATGRSFGSSFTYSTYYSEYSIEFND